MRVLLISRNRVVQELVKLAVKEMEDLELEFAEDPDGLQGDRYDVLLMDDQIKDPAMLEGMEHLIAERRVLLGEYSERHPEEEYDTRVAKPFLPREIRRALRKDSGGTRVLDEEEVWQIRQLLEGVEEEEEQIPEEPEQGFFPLSSEEEEPDGSAAVMRPEELIALVERLGTKKVRKLLKGARISIEIHWPEEE